LLPLSLPLLSLPSFSSIVSPFRNPSAVHCEPFFFRPFPWRTLLFVSLTSFQCCLSLISSRKAFAPPPLGPPAHLVLPDSGPTIDPLLPCLRSRSSPAATFASFIFLCSPRWAQASVFQTSVSWRLRSSFFSPSITTQTRRAIFSRPRSIIRALSTPLTSLFPIALIKTAQP